MEYRKGMWVLNPKRPDWGIGEIVEVEADKVRILFSEAAQKNLVMRLISLQEVPAPTNRATSRPRLRVRPDINMEELERLCKAFHEEFKDRRSNSDDGGMALRVLEDLQSRGDLTRKSAQRLFDWCHTGESYARGVDLAQGICCAIYGRVPTRAELETAGLS